MITKEQYYNFLSEDYVFSENNLLLIEECINMYPYNEAFRYVYLKGWYHLEYSVFKEKLNKSAAFISSRETLFYYIFENDLKNYQIKNKGVKLAEDKTLLLIDVFFEHLGQQQNDKLDIENNSLATTDYLVFLEEHESKKRNKKKVNTIANDLIFVEPVAEEPILQVQPMNIDENGVIQNVEEGLMLQVQPEKQFGNKWYKEIVLDAIGTVIEEEEQVEQEGQADLVVEMPNATQEDLSLERLNLESESLISIYSLDDMDTVTTADEVDEDAISMLPPLKHQNIIDDFLEKEYTPLNTLKKEDLKDDRDYATEEDVSANEESSDNTFFTETLARIYAKQGRFEKAYEIIKHLSLKYPRKNTYFAEQLSYLEKLIINSKHNKK